MPPIFPCYQNKRPACANGFHDASADPAEQAWLWSGRIGLLVGMPTGEPSGLAVLDIDKPGLDWLASANLPATRQHQTRSGGRHLIYRHRLGLRCSQGVIAPGVDVRAEGGYVIWWPSIGFAVDEREVADWPEWLFDMVTSTAQGGTSTRASGNTAHDVPPGAGPGHEHGLFARHDKIGLERRWRGILRIVETAEPGTRNGRLFWAACQFAEFIAEGVLSRSIAEQCLESAARTCGLVRDDGLGAVRATIGSGMRR